MPFAITRSYYIIIDIFLYVFIYFSVISFVTMSNKHRQEAEQFPPEDTSFTAQIARRKAVLEERQDYYDSLGDEEVESPMGIRELVGKRGYAFVGFNDGTYLEVHTKMLDKTTMGAVILSKGAHRVFFANYNSRNFLITSNMTQQKVAEYWLAAREQINQMGEPGEDEDKLNFYFAKAIFNRGDVTLEELEAGALVTKPMVDRAQEYTE